MREISVPAAEKAPMLTSTAVCVFDNARQRPEHVALRRRTGQQWEDVTSAEFAQQVTDLARGLLSAGLESGDRLALMSRTRYEWTLLDFAALAIGVVVVPIYETSSAEQIEWILQDSGARAVVVESTGHAALVESVRTAAPALEQVWVIEEGGVDQLATAGTQIDAAEVHKRLDALTLDDPASIIYTSGTTGRPKGCLLLHRSFVTEMVEVTPELSELFGDDNSILLFLPIAHVLGRVIHIGAIYSGTVLGHTADVANLLPDLAQFKPTFVLSVPRVFEKVFNSARKKAHEEGQLGPIKLPIGRMFDLATGVAVAYSRSLDTGGPSLQLRMQHALFDRLVYGKLRSALGGNCKAAVSGGAPLGERLGHFFRGIGVTIYEGYGLTESTAAVFFNRPELIKIGTVGRPIGTVSAKIADDGELLLRGPLIFAKYWNNDAATAEAKDAEGWFHTGDLGSLDDEGFLRITGRKKEILVTAGGKNVAPAVLEDRLRAHWLISQCMAVGDGQPFIAALITIDPESFPGWLRHHHLPPETTVAQVVDNPELRAEIQRAVDHANQAVSRAEAIRSFVILADDWTEATGELTPSLKVKRRVVQQQCAAQIAALYKDGERV